MALSTGKKEEVAKGILDTLIASLENKNINTDELPKIGKFFSESMEVIEGEQELDEFYAELAREWPIFSNLKTITAGTAKEKVEDEIASGVMELVKHGKINEALSLAKKGTEE